MVASIWRLGDSRITTSAWRAKAGSGNRLSEGDNDKAKEKNSAGKQTDIVKQRPASDWLTTAALANNLTPVSGMASQLYIALVRLDEKHKNRGFEILAKWVPSLDFIFFAMRTVSIDKFIAGLRSIPEECFSVGTVYDYLKEHRVQESTLQPYLFFSEKQYTRNLIFKNSLFELMALCWDVGQVSRIHNHCEQSCWMTVPIGRLRIQNFRVIEQDEKTGHCQIEPTETFQIHTLSPAEVDPTKPVHQVLNPTEFNERAVSLHIYSKPYDRCLVYSVQKNEYQEIQLNYSSEYGKLCEGVRL